MTLLLNKPAPVAALHRTDPLAKGMVCAAALNEPGGASRNLAGSGLLVGTPAAGGLATAITATHEPWYKNFGSGYTFCLWHSGMSLDAWGVLFSVGDGTIAWVQHSSYGWFKVYHNGSGVQISDFLVSEVADPGMLVCGWSGSQMRAYVNGSEVGDAALAMPPKTDSTTSTLSIGGSCTVYLFLAYDRMLTVTEIQRLCREPLALFEEAGCWPPVVAAGGTTHDLAGEVGSLIQLSATLKIARCFSGGIATSGSLTSTLRVGRAVSGVCTAQTNVTASLSTSGTMTFGGIVSATSSASAVLKVTPLASEVTLANEMDWLDAALFHGATASAFQFGTTLTGGWFWMRHEECMGIYRGVSLAQVDFSNVLCVVPHGTQQIVLPDYLDHAPDSGYCYVIRGFNICGHSERTLAAAVMVHFDADGQFVEPMPNGVFGLKADPVAGSRVRLAWFYSPLDQHVEPEVFRIYADNGTGQIDLDTPMAMMPYEGRRFYQCQTEPLSEGLYQFAVVAGRQDRAGRVFLSNVICPIQSHCPEGATVVAAEAIP